jgi:hypothetical protein
MAVVLPPFDEPRHPKPDQRIDAPPSEPPELVNAESPSW